jgi:hypothetical protein
MEKEKFSIYKEVLKYFFQTFREQEINKIRNDYYNFINEITNNVNLFFRLKNIKTLMI